MVQSSDRDVTVITATLGHPWLERALRSVLEQTYPRVRHLVVVDGPDFEPLVRPTVDRAWNGSERTRLLVLPYRTGMDGWCSHRVYAAMAFLVNTEFVCFLDQDNWYEADHIDSLVQAARASESPVAYCLRTIHDRKGEFICRDDCQSLGVLHESFDTPGERHIDTNCWLMSRSLAVKLAPYWHQKYVGDRRLARKVMEAYPNLPCSGQYSLNYTTESRAESASGEYFLHGNEEMRQRYPDGFPWRERAAPRLAEH